MICFFSSRRRHTRFDCDWSSDVCSSDLYTAAAGGISNGSVTLVVPSGWSAPSTTGSNAGYATASSGTVSVSAQTITVSSLTRSEEHTSELQSQSNLVCRLLL